jgi:peptidoglycan/xylan/chitin deacetylase (PgdA/CDA1 family)
MGGTPQERQVKRACVSVDLDGLHHYARIHGLVDSAVSATTRGLHLAVALPRLLALLEAAGVRCTLFVVGEDAVDAGAAALGAAVVKGHELASHSHTHSYALGRAPQAKVEEELAAAEAALTAVGGKRPVGFRAPGYTLSSAMLSALVARGYLYDASVFPAAPYYLAKAAVLSAMALLGRTSASALDSPRVLLAPRVPYRADVTVPYARGTAALLELPMTVTPVLRVPFFGTLLTSAPWPVVERAYRAVARGNFLSLELHAVDVLDAEDGIPEALLRVQRDLRVPRAEKQRRLSQVLGWLKRDFEVCTLEEAARGLDGAL